MKAYSLCNSGDDTFLYEGIQVSGVERWKPPQKGRGNTILTDGNLDDSPRKILEARYVFCDTEVSTFDI